MRAIGYARVSTQGQSSSGLGMEAQRAAVQGYAASKGWSLTWCADEGVSGKSLDRPGLQLALDKLARREADVLVVAKLDRLSRSLADFAGLLELAHKRHWFLVAIDLGVDTSTSAGELVANVMASVARWERRVIGERTSAALKAAQLRGIHVGRPRSLDPEAHRRLLELRASGMSVKRVAKQLNDERVPTAHGGKEWYTTTVQRVLAREET